MIAQVEALDGKDEEISIVRVVRDSPPTPLELATISEALTAFIEPASDLGVAIEKNDLTIRHPSVVLHPIAIFR